jgi:hypothetical protein
VVAETSIGKPYTDDGDIRKIIEDIEVNEYEWHRDAEDRRIEVIEGEGWQLQYNGELPVELIIGDEYDIPKNMYHRVIPGKGDLLVKIQKQE